MDQVHPMDSCVRALLQHRGANSRLAEELGLTRQSVSLWQHTGVPLRWRGSARLKAAVTKLTRIVDDGACLTKWSRPKQGAAVSEKLLQLETGDS